MSLIEDVLSSSSDLNIFLLSRERLSAALNEPHAYLCHFKAKLLNVYALNTHAALPCLKANISDVKSD